ncbi:helix-turn-helix transcriptional regulator [Pseudonocardia adelaidensis]|uniref:HTH cro/C1-type domain-containing protein n=1 Tax=Pseudonocardia adelaidensis TaxID=648754 RepID=A0ABP9NGL9_9PSEU
MVARSARLREQLALAESLRADGRTWSEAAAALRTRYGLNARVAMRIAHGWTQADTAQAWSRRWPDEPKTFKNISYWENWPSPTGHMPSLHVLDRLARIYECDVADLLAGWGEYGGDRSYDDGTEPETLAWQVGNLDLHQLTRAVADWAQRLPGDQRRAMLLKLSTAAALAATASPTSPPLGQPRTVGASALAGRWSSTYRYHSTSRGADLEGTHVIDLRTEDGRLTGRSLAHPQRSVLDLDLLVNGTIASGAWTERTSPTGHYRAATYQGLIQLVIDPAGRQMVGRWLGVGKRFEVKSGEWRLTWADQPEPAGGRPVTTATTLEPSAKAPSEMSANTASISFPT